MLERWDLRVPTMVDEPGAHRVLPIGRLPSRPRIPDDVSRATDGDYRLRRFSCWDQFLCLAFCPVHLPRESARHRGMSARPHQTSCTTWASVAESLVRHWRMRTKNMTTGVSSSPISRRSFIQRAPAASTLAIRLAWELQNSAYALDFDDDRPVPGDVSLGLVSVSRRARPKECTR